MMAVHDFVIVIPVADRPRQLADCLESLRELCSRYPYEGEVTVVIVDDSGEEGSVEKNREVAGFFNRPPLPNPSPTEWGGAFHPSPLGGEGLGERGTKKTGLTSKLSVHHLDQPQQRALIASLPDSLQTIVGDANAAAFHHKGASITRNIAYLWLKQLPPSKRERLFWFLDSDQEFRVNVETAEGEDQPYAVDYLHDLDRIFTETPTRVLTGKVVGDPPVSPAVMAGTFLDDVLAFLAEMAALSPSAACTFHGPARPADDAAYHDMAELFGFKPADAAYRYRCHLHGDHDHRTCFADFAGRLKRFFDGEHPTRRGYYQPDDLMAGIKPARTIYTGNYVVTEAGLDLFVPFAGLKLRMAGPTLGRIVRAEIGDAFVSANLPMLHKRTVAETGQSEYRPGVERADAGVDLSGEFERQYFGDVMLFTMEKLTGQGFPATPPNPARIAATVEAVEVGMRESYRTKQTRTAAKIERLAALFDAPGHWWGADEQQAEAGAAFRRFIADMRRNFAADAPAWRLIEANRAGRLAAIRAAIAGYRTDRAAWRAALKLPSPPGGAGSENRRET